MAEAPPHVHNGRDSHIQASTHTHPATSSMKKEPGWHVTIRAMSTST